MNLQFIESPVYSDQIDDLLSAEDHRQLQMHLLLTHQKLLLKKHQPLLKKLQLQTLLPLRTSPSKAVCNRLAGESRPTDLLIRFFNKGQQQWRTTLPLTSRRSASVLVLE